MLNYVNSKKIKFESYNSYIIESCENKMILDVFTKYDENNTLNGIIIKACTKEQIYQMCFSLYYQILKNFKIFMNIPFLEFYRRFRILLRLNFINIVENYEIIEISEDEYEKDYFVVITKRWQMLEKV